MVSKTDLKDLMIYYKPTRKSNSNRDAWISLFCFGFLFIPLFGKCLLHCHHERNFHRSNLERAEEKFKKEQMKINKTMDGMKKVSFEPDSKMHETCSICLGDFKEKEELNETECKHQFHHKCI